MTDLVARLSGTSRNEHMTFRANMGVGRHGWLRLTPAYGVKLVRERISHLPEGSIVTDPFSGTGTTPLAAAELGYVGQSVDINPFLVWLGNVKVTNYSERTLKQVSSTAVEAVQLAEGQLASDSLWQPDLFKIEKWWGPGALHALKCLRFVIDTAEGQVRDLLEVGLSRTLIACSNAAFNHQSMSFKDEAGFPQEFDESDVRRTLMVFSEEISTVVESARLDLEGSARVFQGDSRSERQEPLVADLILTSPPYVNRMSYIRELRPYMYWLRFLDSAQDAGDLDWKAIGGTWGSATSKLNSWQAETETPIDSQMQVVCNKIADGGGKNGPLLATYVHKYHHDMWMHFQGISERLRSGGSLSYIVGNSTFYTHEVPVQEWYAEMLRHLGYEDVTVNVIRKRNSNRALFEYEVSARKPL